MSGGPNKTRINVMQTQYIANDTSHQMGIKGNLWVKSATIADMPVKNDNCLAIMLIFFDFNTS